jgi:LuxR family quorum-sensing system transcriptional regulator CciR
LASRQGAAPINHRRNVFFAAKGALRMTSLGHGNSFFTVQAYVRMVRDAQSLTDIGLILKDATRSLQFDHYALAQRISSTRLGVLRLSDFPDHWVEQLVGDRLIADDPVLLASSRQVTPFAWSNLPALLPMTGRQRAYMAAARNAGLSDGFTVPIHIPGQASGLVSFVVGSDAGLPSDTLPAAQYLACFAFEAARRLRLSDRGVDEQHPRLTQRQLDCLVLAARGKSNWVAGQLLGLSAGTVHKYLEAAKQRYGVSSRTELVVRALYDGHINFADVMGDMPADG